MGYEAVVMGASAGGMKALFEIFSNLSDTYAFPTIIAQHRHPSSQNYLADLLSTKCRKSAKEAVEKEEIVPGVIYIAPPDYHLMIEEDRTFSLCASEPVNYARPSIDVLFETAAEVYGTKLIGVVLTGANHDGSQGLKKIQEACGLTIVQDPVTAEIDRMPKAAIAAVEVDHILTLKEIGSFLADINKRCNY